MGVVLLLVIVLLGLIATLGRRTKSPAKSSSSGPAVGRGAHRRPSSAFPQTPRSHLLGSPSRRAERQWAVHGGAATAPAGHSSVSPGSSEAVTPRPLPEARYAPSRRPVESSVPVWPTAPALHAPSAPSGSSLPLTGGISSAARPAAPDPVALAAPGDAAWVPAGQTVSIGGFSISGGLIYVGRHLPGPASGKPDPALVDPSLTIDRQAPDYVGAHMGY